MDALACILQKIARSRAVGVETVIVAWVAGLGDDGEATYGALDEVVHAGCLT